MTPDAFRRLALAIDGAEEGQHVGHPDFRIGGRIFASMRPEKGHGTVKLTPEELALAVANAPDVFVPAAGAWGAQGWTMVVLKHATKAVVVGALDRAAANVRAKLKAPKKPPTARPRRPGTR